MTASLLVHYRTHPQQITNDVLRRFEAAYQVHRWHVDAAHDRRLVRGVLAEDLRTIGRLRADAGDRRSARTAYVGSLRRTPRPGSFAWVLALSVPGARKPAARLARLRHRLLGSRLFAHFATRVRSG